MAWNHGLSHVYSPLGQNSVLPSCQRMNEGSSEHMWGLYLSCKQTLWATERYCPYSHGQELLIEDRQWQLGRRKSFVLEIPSSSHTHPPRWSQPETIWALLMLSGRQKRWRCGCSLNGSAGIRGCRKSLVLISKPSPGSWTQCKEPQTSGTLTSRL